METTRRRHPKAAVLLSLLAPGLGHLYCGQAARGLVLVVLGVTLGPLGLFGFVPVSSAFRTAALAAFFAFTALWIWAMRDAARAARRIGDGYVLKDYNRWTVYALLAFLAVPVAAGWGAYVRAGIVQAYRIPTRSMAPTIRPGDRVFTNKLAYREEPVRRGDVVVFPNPNARHQAQIKRVVALAGDRVAMRDGALIVNGEELPREPAAGPAPEADPELAGTVAFEANGESRYRVLLAPKGERGDCCRDLAERTVPDGHCFVLGDNRDRAQDSRSYGPVPLADLVGRVERVWWPRWEKVD